MPDMDRAAITRLVYQRLADPKFQRRLTAIAPDGSRPIIVALLDDQMQALIDKVRAAGGVGNVVVPALNGIVVIATEAMPLSRRPLKDPAQAQLLRSDCTVGVFVERLWLEAGAGGSAAYDFAVSGPDESTERGHAQVVALAG